jgi:hypothetical protein
MGKVLLLTPLPGLKYGICLRNQALSVQFLYKINREREEKEVRESCFLTFPPYAHSGLKRCKSLRFREDAPIKRTKNARH